MIRIDRPDSGGCWQIQVDHTTDTDRLAAKLAPLCGPGTVVALDGDLGAGKTRFSQAFASGLGVQETVNSPTFTIIKQYEQAQLPLYHMDVYRITEAEAGELGLEDYFYGEGITLVEWAERIVGELPEEYLHVRIMRNEQEDGRDITIEPRGERYEELSERWVRSLESDANSGMQVRHAGQTPSRILALDTSTGMLSAVVLIDGQVAAERHSEAERNHSIRLVPAIGELLDEAGLAPTDLEGIAVGTGPGSYTGVRIAVTVAKTMAWTLGIPLVRVSTLAALALSGKQALKNGQQSASVWVAPILDARRENVYTGLYALWDGAANMQNLSGDSNRQLKQWLDKLVQAAAEGTLDGVTVERPSELVVVGETERFHPQLQAAAERARQAGISFSWQQCRLNAAHAGALGIMSEWLRDGVHEVVPNYTQLAEAEAKLLANRAERDGR